jgi:hypothetical protein
MGPSVCKPKTKERQQKKKYASQGAHFQDGKRNQKFRGTSQPFVEKLICQKSFDSGWQSGSECLLSKHEALSSNPRTAKKKKKKALTLIPPGTSDPKDLWS